jgi:hypothetical protein
LIAAYRNRNCGFLLLQFSGRFAIRMKNTHAYLLEDDVPADVNKTVPTK